MRATSGSIRTARFPTVHRVRQNAIFGKRFNPMRLASARVASDLQKII
jgi:hypothetical protein